MMDDKQEANDAVSQFQGHEDTSLGQREEDIEAKARTRKGAVGAQHAQTAGTSVGKGPGHPETKEGDMHHTSGERTTLQRMEEETEAKVRARLGAVGPGAVAVSGRPLHSDSKVMASQNTQSSSATASRSTHEEDMEAKARAREGTVLHTTSRSTRTRLQDMEADAQAKAQGSIGSAATRPGAVRMEGSDYSDFQVKPVASSGTPRSQPTANDRAISHTLEGDIETKSCARSGAVGSGGGSYRRHSPSAMEEDLVAKTRNVAVSPRIAARPRDPQEVAGLSRSALRHAEGEIEAKARGHHTTEMMEKSRDHGGYSDRSRLHALEAELAEKKASRHRAKDVKQSFRVERAASARAAVEPLTEGGAGGSRAAMSYSQELDSPDNVPGSKDAPGDNNYHGAFNVAPSGVVEPRNRGALSGHPNRPSIAGPPVLQQSIRPNYSADASSGHMEVEHVTENDTVENDTVPSQEQAMEQQAGKDESSPFLNRRALVVLVVVALGGVAAVVAIVLGGGSDNSGDDGSTPAPSGSPTGHGTSPRSYIEDSVSTKEALDDSESPQFHALQWVSDDPVSMQALESDPVDESQLQRLVTRYVLAVLYYALDGDSWFSATGWLDENQNECYWEFLSCDSGLVTVINTGGAGNMRGELPSELQSIPSLQEVRLASNSLTGLAGNLGDLVVLDLSSNEIKGEFPSFVYSMTNLEELKLGSNELSGTVSSMITQLSGLRVLDLSDNGLSGSFPILDETMASLQRISLGSRNDIPGLGSGNNFQGLFRETFYSLPELVTLQVAGNSFNGSLGSELGSLSSLVTLNVRENALDGPIPSEIGLLDNLTAIILGRNSLKGFIPSEIGALGQLIKLDIELNFLSGELPTEVGSLSTLTELWSEGSGLSGGIPTEVGNMTSLEKLELGSNDLTGTIPTEFGLCRKLAFLLLDGNQLSGAVPAEIGELRLQYLYLHSNNDLTGAIPDTLCDVGRLKSIRAPCTVNCPCDKCLQCG